MSFLAGNTQDGFGEHRYKKYPMCTIKYTAVFLMLWAYISAGGPGHLFFVINIFFFFSHITQHSIQNITKQNNRHKLNISKSSQKGGREGRTIKTQKSLL